MDIYFHRNSLMNLITDMITEIWFLFGQWINFVIFKKKLIVAVIW